MKYYCECISVPLAEKLKEKGMSIDWDMNWTEEVYRTNKIKLICPTYAEVFDWLMLEKEIYIRIIPLREVKGINGTLWAWSWFMNRLTKPSINSDNFWMNWHEVADAAIEKTLELI